MSVTAARADATPAQLLNAPLRLQMTTILHGAEALAEIPGVMDELGISRVVVVASPSASKSALLIRLRSLLGERIVGIFDRCGAHTPIESVHELISLVRESNAQGFITLGGGSTVDTAKVAAALIGEGQPAEDLITEFRPPSTYIERYLRRPKPPIIAIPCTLSGAETGPRAGFISADKIKRIVGGDFMAARVLVLDPAATFDVDVDVFVRSGLNGLAHAIEGLYSRRRNPIADAFALEAIALFVKNLPIAKQRPDDAQARLELLYAGYLGGMVLLTSRMGIHHAVCHCLGGRLGLSHGTVNSVMLPYSMQFNLDAATSALAKAARAMGVGVKDNDRDAAQAGIAKVMEVRERIGVPHRLRDLPRPPTDDDLEFVINDVKIERGVYFNPRVITSRDDIAEIVKSAH